MKIASLFADGRPVLASSEGAGWRNLSAADATLGADVGALLASGPDWLERARRAADRAPWLEVPALRFRPVVPRPSKMWCLGLNDVDHAKEAGLPIPELPVVFARFPSSLIGHGEPLRRPVESQLLDWEVELAVVIGRAGRRIPEADALDHVAGYTVFNDGTVRDWQTRTPQWTLGKNFDGTGALGPALVTADELPPGAAGLRMTTRVGDALMQDGDTGKMVFPVAQTIAHLSQAASLEPGDVIAMGTPSGIGHARKPPRYLVPGETVTVAIEGIGELSNPVVDDAEERPSSIPPAPPRAAHP